MDIEQAEESLDDRLQDLIPPFLEILPVEVVVAQHSLLAEELCRERTLGQMLVHTAPEVALDLRIVGYVVDLGKSKNGLFHSIAGDRVNCWRRNVPEFEIVKGHAFDLD